MGQGWDNAVARDFLAKIKLIAEEYPSEFDLLNNAATFGSAVYQALVETDEVEFSGEQS